MKKIKMPKNWGKVKVGGKLVDPFAEKKCVWRERVAGIITTQCWHAFGGADFIKSFIFCPFCGRKIERITK